MKEFNASELETNRLYPVCLELMWQIRMSPSDTEVGSPGPFSQRISQAYIALVAALSLDSGFDATSIFRHIMDQDFKRWMESPEGIEHNRRILA